MASDAPLRSARLPSQQQVMELLDGEFTRAGFELADVVVEASSRPARIVVIADGDELPDLEAIAALSRSSSELLDKLEDSDPYVLEVTTPGVDRPLKAERHYRRARGRKVDLELSDGTQLTGRLGELAEGVVALVVAGKRQGDYTVREFPLVEIVKAVVQVDFSTPNPRELELAGGQLGDDRGIHSTQSGKEADA
ncbi:MULTISPECIES: ribosome maturation factor RimP [unclassified Mycobacterium]|uniref:ribosome maturation factor RimP n=1 Tax=unclassified Mycobacterium TaxID=2642494 RepID=UPI0029C63CCD|nr:MULTISPECIES: ribosome maturation factor RimP [unclassified Mycobacterium]